MTDGGVHPRPSGITIIVGPNEIGKSSLLEGLDLLLNELDSSLKREVKQAKPIGRDEGPSVEAEIEAGTYRFRIRKRWLRRPETELRVSQPRAEVMTGREAHERMREILESAVDIELLGALRYLQGASVGPPQLPTSGLLTEALDKATGGASDTQESASLFETAEEEYSKYFSGGGKEVRAIQELRRNTSDLQVRVAELQTEAAQVQIEADRFERFSRELDALRLRLLALEADQKTWGERLQEVKRIEDRKKVANAEFETARERHSRTVAEVRARTELVQAIAGLHRDVEGLKAAYEEELPELERARERSRQTEEDSGKAERRTEASEKAASLTKNDHELLRLQFDFQLLSERGTRAERALRDSREAAQAMAKGGVTDERLEELRALQTSVTVAQQKLAVASPTLAITALTDFHPVVAGETISLRKGEVHQTPIPEAVIVDIPNRVRLEIRPGMSLSKLQENQREARTAWEAALKKAEVRDLAGAVESNRSRTEATSRKKEADKSLRLALRSDDPEPFENVEELLAKVSELRSRIEKLEKSRPSGHPLPEKREAAERLARDAQQSLVAAQAGQKTSRELAKRAREDLGKRQVREAELRSRRDQASETVESRQRVLAEERARTSDEAVARLAEEASAEADTKRTAAEEVDGELRKADPEAVRTRATSVDAAVLKTRNELGTIQTSLTESATRVEIAANKGIYDLLGAAQRELGLKVGELASIERRASAAKLLLETLSLHRAEAQRAYVGPLRDQIEQLGRLLHGPTFKVTMAQDLSIESRELDGLPVPFDLLSTGATEQLGIIVRLAAAMLVGKNGQGVPVIIDDALGFSDPERLKAMGAVLDQAGKECQVLILTCYPERYGAVGSAEVVRFGP